MKLDKERIQAPESDWINGYFFCLERDHTSEIQEQTKGLPSICPSCATDYTRRLFRQSPIRGFRTGFSKVTQLLTKELFYQQPDKDLRKLVVFSDSREDAATVANGVERSHYFDLIREAVFDELRKFAVGEPMLLADLQENSEPKSELAVQFASENPIRAKELLESIKKSKQDPNDESIPDEFKEMIADSIENAKKYIETIEEISRTR